MQQIQISFQDAVKRAFSNYCCFSGRASRSEFWWFTLFCFILSVVCSTVGAVSGSQYVGPVLSIIVGLVTLLPSLGLCWRRLHDIGRAGGWYFIGLIPLVGMIILLVWFAKESEPTPNRFGAVPNLVG